MCEILHTKSHKHVLTDKRVCLILRRNFFDSVLPPTGFVLFDDDAAHLMCSDWTLPNAKCSEQLWDGQLWI